MRPKHSAMARAAQRQHAKKLSHIFYKSTYIAAVFTFLYTFPGIDELEITNFIFHMMVEHFLFASSGFLILSLSEDIIQLILTSSRHSPRVSMLRAFYTRFLVLNKKLNWSGVPGLTGAAAILGYWHIPDVLVNGTLDSLLHEIMHISFMVLGGLVYLSVKQLSPPRRAVIAIAFGKVMLWAGLYLSQVSDYVYKLYPLSQHHDAGIIMLVAAPLMDFAAVGYLVHTLISRGQGVVVEQKR